MTAVTAGAQAGFGGGRRVHVVQAEQGRADHGRDVDDAHPGLGAAAASWPVMPSISSGFRAREAARNRRWAGRWAGCQTTSLSQRRAPDDMIVTTTRLRMLICGLLGPRAGR